MSRFKFAAALIFYLATAVFASSGMTVMASGGDIKTVTLLTLIAGILLIVSIVLTVIP